MISLERTLVDVMDRPHLSGSWEEIWRSLEMIKHINIDNVIEYALLLNNSTTIAKVGYYIEQHRDVLDIADYQLHALDDPEELRIALSEDGAIRTILDAKMQGLVKYIGITSHNPENIMKALESFDFDTVLLPVNYVLRAHPKPKNDYEPVISLAKKRNLGVIAMKSVAKGPWPTDKRPYNTWYQPFDSQREVNEALWFTLSQCVTTATSSSDIRIAKMMIDAAECYNPMEEEKRAKLLLKAATYNPLFPRTNMV